MKIYKIEPALVNYLWGGSKLVRDWNKNGDVADKIGESWELSFHKNGMSKINGKNICDFLEKKDLGENVVDFPFFPTLTKIIDANDFLSIQVHPGDDYSLQNEGELGKTEMWYILDAEKDAGIYLGFKKSFTKDEFSNSIENGEILDELNFTKVQKGECYFIPSGVVHAIGKGVTVFEIQQNSNITYRIFDFNRIDSDGKSRVLHIEQSKDVSILEPYHCNNSRQMLEPSCERLGLSKYFSTYRYFGKENYTLHADEKSFHAVTFMGKGKIDNQSFQKGETFFVPANFGIYIVETEDEFILTKIEKFTFVIKDKQISLRNDDMFEIGCLDLDENVSLENSFTALLDKCGMVIGDVDFIEISVTQSNDKLKSWIRSFAHENNLKIK